MSPPDCSEVSGVVGGVRHVVAVVGVLFLVGLAAVALPFEVLATWSVVVILVETAFSGVRWTNRVAALQRTLY